MLYLGKWYIGILCVMLQLFCKFETKPKQKVTEKEKTKATISRSRQNCLLGLDIKENWRACSKPVRKESRWEKGGTEFHIQKNTLWAMDILVKASYSI